MNSFRVSVIIPVFNAFPFLESAVNSAAQILEVEEILLIEDNSIDGSKELCRDLSLKFEKVKTYFNERNIGPGASRNIGLKESKCPFVSFLDADDLYLPDRFEVEKEIFKNPEVDGVYGATGFIEEEGCSSKRLTTFKKKVAPEELLYNIVTRGGRFSTNAITLKKTILCKAGFFNVDLRLHQDTHMWYKIAHFGKIVPGEITRPIAMRRIHPNNRIATKDFASRALLHKIVFNDFVQFKNVDRRVMRIFINRYLYSSQPQGLLKYFYYMNFFFKSPLLFRFYF